MIDVDIVVVSHIQEYLILLKGLRFTTFDFYYSIKKLFIASLLDVTRNFRVKYRAFKYTGKAKRYLLFIHVDLLGHLKLRVSKSMIETLTRTYGIHVPTILLFPWLTYIFYQEFKSSISWGKMNLCSRGELCCCREFSIH